MLAGEQLSVGDAAALSEASASSSVAVPASRSDERKLDLGGF